MVATHKWSFKMGNSCVKNTRCTFSFVRRSPSASLNFALISPHKSPVACPLLLDTTPFTIPSIRPSDLVQLPIAVSISLTSVGISLNILSSRNHSSKSFKCVWISCNSKTIEWISGSWSSSYIRSRAYALFPAMSPQCTTASFASCSDIMVYDRMPT